MEGEHQSRNAGRLRFRETPENGDPMDHRLRLRRLAAPSAILLALAGFMLVLLPGVSEADQFFGLPCNAAAETPCVPDNFEHTYCWGNSFDGQSVRDAAHYGMSNLDQQTQYDRNFLGGSANCSSTTDVVWREFNDPTLRGRYDCTATNGSSECEHSIIFMNPANLANQLNKDKTACHEIGHSGGLSHSDNVNDCMISGHVSQNHRDYNDHHRTHLNNRS
jgi:hypothetical protein